MHVSGAPVAGGATSPASRFGGRGVEARFMRFLARVGRRLTGIAYRDLRRLEKLRTSMASDGDDRTGPAGAPSRTAGAPSPGETRH